MKTTLFAALTALALTPAAHAAEVTLRLQHFLSAQAPIQTEVLEPWAKTLSEQSDGRIEVQIYPSMQLGGKPPQLYDQARDGVVDISWTLLGYTPGRFPVSEVFELPFVAGSATQTTNALQQFQAKYLADELRDVQPLLLHAPAAYKFHLKGKPVNTLADLRGLKLRAPSRMMTDALNALGAVAVGMPVPEVPQALTTGVIDGALIPWEVVGSLRVNEMVRDHTEIGAENGGMSTSVMALVMNKAKYDSLPDDLRAILDANSGVALAALAGPAFDRAEEAERQKALDGGATIAVIPADALAEWQAATQPITDAWLKTMVDAGHDGQAMLDDARAMIAAQ
ncbi:MAG: TRAP transporter substrate-binding protein [Paracoccus sp. (in: a-proteobacteria)]|uniref:TRAP transporter substrate-binding protein n=1 Tax=Paracoccus sp. TaxID=267 RepID=UPI0026DED7D8|nr:TRAP transporter substrate-binding protein [Paracoccus sp. (in: a-proteobacteria)]MDO5620320.1 TRAP transporter substrate-binding protein [Paracoccus sp. (in: a-proteobacteria)]